MFYLVIGGSGSGKSAYAEELMTGFQDVGKKYYLATMQVFDEEGKKKIERHRRLRQGKGFETIESPRDISRMAEKIEPVSAVLLECMSNLTANEMFAEHGVCSAKAVTEKILSDVRELKKRAKHLVIVSNNVFEDGITYDAATMDYIGALGKTNQALLREADTAVEVVVGLPLLLKGENQSCGF